MPASDRPRPRARRDGASLISEPAAPSEKARRSARMRELWYSPPGESPKDYVDRMLGRRPGAEPAEPAEPEEGFDAPSRVVVRPWWGWLG